VRLKHSHAPFLMFTPLYTLLRYPMVVITSEQRGRATVILYHQSPILLSYLITSLNYIHARLILTPFLIFPCILTSLTLSSLLSAYVLRLRFIFLLLLAKDRRLSYYILSYHTMSYLKSFNKILIQNILAPVSTVPLHFFL